MEQVNSSIQNLANNQLFADQQLLMGTKQIDKMEKDNLMIAQETAALTQKISILTGIVDPVAQAANYKKVFTECCPTPQYTGGCGCGNC